MRRSQAAIVLALGVAILAASTPASADTVSVAEYGARLVQARGHVVAGRIADARATLLRTTAVRVGDAAVAVDDGPLAARVAADRDIALAHIDARIANVERALRPPHDQSRADDALRALLREDAPAAAAGSFTALIVALLRRAFDALGRPDLLALVPTQIAAGLALVLVLLVIVVRGVRERLRSETSLPDLRRGDRFDPAGLLRAAEDAASRADRRAAIHLWYRYAFAALDAREAFAYDPALTDRELLVRAAGIPNVASLRDLVALHDRVWFGLREAHEDEAARAGSLARRVAA